MPLKPLGRRLLIKPDPESDKIGVLYIPENAVEKPWTGQVIDIGNKFKEATEDLPKIGDRVYYRQGYGKDVVINDESHILIALEDVLGVLT